MNHDLFLFFTAWYAGNQVRKAVQTIAQNDRTNARNQINRHTKSQLLTIYFKYADITIGYKYCFIKISAICTLFNAAPFRTLSATTHISSPRS